MNELFVIIIFVAVFHVNIVISYVILMTFFYLLNGLLKIASLSNLTDILFKKI